MADTNTDIHDTTEAGSSDLATRVFWITLFHDELADRKHYGTTTLLRLRDEILKTTAKKKDTLPWIKLATFGDKPNENNCLRYDENVIETSGAEGDYDGELLPDGKQISFAEAIAIIREANIRALVYTSPSHKLLKPRWRVLMPFSEHLPPEKRRTMVARLNGLLKGLLGNESFTLSQSYYFGKVGNNPDHKVIVLDGDFIDARADLDAGALFESKKKKPAGNSRAKTKSNGKGNGPADLFEQYGESISGSSTAWRDLNDAALANLAAWVPDLFPDLDLKQRENGSYRITSKQLNRDLEEDLAITPDGIKDWGVHDIGDEREGCRTAIDLVMEYGYPDFNDAVAWLRERLGLETETKAREAEPDDRDDDTDDNPPQKQSANAQVVKLNETYALVIVGDKTVIMKNVGSEINFLTVSAFEQWHANRHVRCNDKKVSLGKYWLTHPQRRQYEGITFSPAAGAPARHFNLWRGFSVEPKQGDCSKFLAHIKDNVCRGDTAMCNWVIGWFAQIVQRPDKKMGTSLVLRGKQGTGKTKVGEVFGSLLGPHYVAVSDPRYITGRFNSHLVACLLLHADEAFWAGDHAAEGKLKDLVTGDTQWIEFKGKEPISIRNFVRLCVCGNPDWLVPAGFDERRFAIFDVGEDKMQDKKYFAAIDDEMDNGGREALLHHLLIFDLTNIDLRTIPKTEALFEQQVSSLTSEQSWWLDTLMRGELPWGCELPGACPTNRLFDRYITRATRQGARRRAIETQLGGFLRKHVPKLERSRSFYKRWNDTRHKMVDQRGWVYDFPPLKDCRAAFAAKMGADIKWNDGDDDWELEPPPDPNDNPNDTPF
jgi:hypothetical protein